MPKIKVLPDDVILKIAEITSEYSTRSSQLCKDSSIPVSNSIPK